MTDSIAPAGNVTFLSLSDSIQNRRFPFTLSFCILPPYSLGLSFCRIRELNEIIHMRYHEVQLPIICMIRWLPEFLASSPMPRACSLFIWLRGSRVKRQVCMLWQQADLDLNSCWNMNWWYVMAQCFDLSGLQVPHP